MVLLILAASSTARAQVILGGYGGCIASDMIPVRTAVADVPDLAKADFQDHLIVVNPAASSFSPVMKLWAYWHECGHFAVPTLNEQVADCYSIRRLVFLGLTLSQYQALKQEVAGLGSGDWVHLPGPQRAINLDACLESPVFGPPLIPRPG